MDDLEYEDDDFKELLYEQRHKELLYAVRALKDGKDDSSIKELAQTVVNSIDRVIKSIPPPNVSVTNKNEELVSEMAQIKALLLELNKNLCKKEPVYEFQFNRNGYGYIESIIAKTK